jgi:hypothetical protein
MDDQNTPSDPTDDAPTPPPANSPEPAPAAVEPDSGQPTGSDPANTPPIAPESPINDDSSAPVEDQNPPINQLESEAPDEPISVPNEPEIPVDDQSISESTPATDEPPISQPAPAPPQPQPTSEPVLGSPVQAASPASAPSQSETAQPLSPTQQNQVGFIHSLLVKAQAKIQSNKQKKLNEIIQLAQKKQTIKNEDVQKLLRISSATATRYLVKLVQQGHLIRVGSPRDAKYQFLN